MKTRLLMDQQYTSQRQEGKRIRKQGFQNETLIAHFNANPIWDYPKKVKIAEEIGMTFN